MYAAYQLCGAEALPMIEAGAFALAAGIIGVVAAVCVLPGLLRYGVRRNVPPENP